MNESIVNLPRDKDGYIVLEFSEEGETKLVSVNSANKLLTDNKRLEDALDELYIAAKSGNYKKLAVDEEIFSLIQQFIEHHEPIQTGSVEESIAANIITLAKSVYEYSGSKYQFIPDILYDQINSEWKASGRAELLPLVPKKSGVEKIEIKYKTLANNLDKAYRVRGSDKLPQGVAEKNTVEEFLDKVYEALNTNSSRKIELEITPKLDGISVNTELVDGKFVDPATRGDSGEGVLIKGLEGYSPFVDFRTWSHEPFGIQYEAYVTKENRKAVMEIIKTLDKDKTDDSEYVNCRSAASGIISRMYKDPDRIDLAPYLSFYPITSEGLLDGSEAPMTYKAQRASIQTLGRNPDDIIQPKYISGNKKMLLATIANYFKDTNNRRDSLSYEIDGIVITVCDDNYQAILGREGNTNKYQIALKFPPQDAVGEIDHIGLSSGNKGQRAVMIYLKTPVTINGVSYSKIKLRSIANFDSYGYQVGTKIGIIRTGDAIPAVGDIIKKAPDGAECLKLPDVCPSCGGKLAVANGVLVCTNTDCPDNITGKFVNCFNELCLDGYSLDFASKLLEKAGVDSMEKLIDVTKESLAASGMKTPTELSFPGVFHSAVKNSPQYVILSALGFSKIARATAKSIMAAIGNTPLKDITEEELAVRLKHYRINKMAEPFAKTIVDNRDLILKWFEKSDFGVSDFSKMRTIGHTGIKAFPVDLQRRLLKQNIDVTDDKRFDLLVTASDGMTTSKVKLANERNIPIVSLNEFVDKFDEYVTFIKKLDQKNRLIEDVGDVGAEYIIPEAFKYGFNDSGLKVEPIQEDSTSEVILLRPSSDKARDHSIDSHNVIDTTEESVKLSSNDDIVQQLLTKISALESEVRELKNSKTTSAYVKPDETSSTRVQDMSESEADDKHLEYAKQDAEVEKMFGIDISKYKNPDGSKFNRAYYGSDEYLYYSVLMFNTCHIANNRSAAYAIAKYSKKVDPHCL